MDSVLINECIEASVRGIVLYFVILTSLRLLGKKNVGQLTLADLVLVLLISKSLYSDSGLAPSIAMVLSLVLVNYLLNWLIFKSKKFKKVAEGEPVILICDGNLLMKALQSEKLTIDDIMEGLRRKGCEKVKDVKWAILETNGEISVVPKN